MVETQNTLGTASELSGNLKEAILAFQEAIRFAPSVWSIHLNLARSLAATGRFGEAFQEYRFLLDHQPDNADFLCDASVCIYKLGDVDEAVKYFRRALEINPNLQNARSSLEIAEKKRHGAGSI